MSTKNLSANEIILRIYRAASVDSDVKLSKLLGYSSTGTISQWRATGRVPDRAISKISEMFGTPFEEIKYGKRYENQPDGNCIKEKNSEYLALLDYYKEADPVIREAALTMLKNSAEQSRAKDGGGSNSADRKSALR